MKYFIGSPKLDANGQIEWDQNHNTKKYSVIIPLGSGSAMTYYPRKSSLKMTAGEQYFFKVDNDRFLSIVKELDFLQAVKLAEGSYINSYSSSDEDEYDDEYGDEDGEVVVEETVVVETPAPVSAPQRKKKKK